MKISTLPLRALISFRILIISLASCESLLGQDYPEMRQTATLYQYWSGVSCIEISDTLALLGTEKTGISVIDVKKPDEMRELARCILPARPSDVSVQGNFAYVACQTAGLQIVEFTDPARPVIVGSMETGGFASRLQIVEDLIYLADTSALRIIDISEPTRPDEIGSFPTAGYLYNLIVRGDYAYLVDRHDWQIDPGLRIVDISDPSQPRETAFLEIPGSPDGIALIDNYLYIGNHASPLRIIDVSDPRSPQVVAEVAAIDFASRLAIDRNFLYVSDTHSKIYDISSRRNPRFIDSLAITERSGDFAFNDGKVYLAGEISLIIAENAPGNDPQVLGTFSKVGRAIGVTIFNRSLITSGAPYLSMDYSPLSPRIQPTSAKTVARGGYCATVLGSYLYCGTGFTGDDSGIRIYDISNPDHFEEVGSCGLGGSTVDIAISGTYAFATLAWVGRENPEFKVVDVSDPANPELVASLNLAGSSAQCITIEGSRAYVGNSASGIRIINISNPRQPFEVGSCRGPSYPKSIIIRGEYAYVGDFGDGGLWVMNIADPESARVVGFCGTPERIWDIALFNNYVFIANLEHGIWVADVSNPEEPFICGHNEAIYKAYGVDVSQEGIVVVADEYEIVTYDALDVMFAPSSSSDVLHPSSLIMSAYPNPFNSSTTINYTLPRPGRYAIDVIDLQGRLITRLSDGWKEAGSYREVLNGKGIPSGILILNVSDGSHSRNQTIQLIR